MFFSRDEINRFSSEGKIVPLIPLRDLVILPYMVVPLYVGREKSIAALDEAMKTDKDVVLATQKKAKLDDPNPEDIYEVGTLASILQMLKLPDGTVKVLMEGKKRVRIKNFIETSRLFTVLVEEIKDVIEYSKEVEALTRNIINTFEQYIKLNPKIPPEMLVSIQSIDDPSRLADIVASHLNIKVEEKQKILEMVNVNQRLEKVFEAIQGEMEVLELEKRIRNRVKKQMEKAQKEYYLNEQMKAIQKELGEKDEMQNEIAELEERMKKKKLSPEAHKKIEQEIKKLKLMSPLSAEATVVRNYIDWVLALPWNEKTEEKLDIAEAEKILDEDHYGLQQVKERIIEYLAVRSRLKKMKGPILCFVGPPGVGKTSLAKSIARATGRKFVRISLGGVRDEAEIRGHRRTYIGALPGKIIQGMKKAGSSNPVFLLDEIDKMSVDFRGDPSSALLEVLDPEQNYMFQDHYIDLDYDLSEVMFITTANMVHTIPPPLLDRMEVIRLPGYTEYEKFHIAKQFLVPKQMEAHGLNKDNIEFTKEAIYGIIRQYTKEAGVRNLEREIATICRKVAKKLAKEKTEKKVTIRVRSLHKFLGVPKFRHSTAEEKDEIGVTNGLAWTEFGGELLQTEVAIMPGKGKLTVTGKLGEVMQESAQAALSYVRSRSELFGIEKDFYQKIDIHIHVPEGAIPKDGPSAGITMATSIVSALLKIPVRRDVAMTGEITLRGRVLPIGGLKEKLLAAHRAKIKNIIIPKENEKDLKEVPENILKDLNIILVEHMDEVILKSLRTDDPSKILKKVEPEKQPEPTEKITTSEKPAGDEITAH